MAITKDAEYVLKTVKEKDIAFIRFWFTDVLGFLKSFAITPAELETAFSDGMGFDGSSIEGFARIQESDMMAIPDPSTFELLPWRPSEQGVARMFCDVQTTGGQPFDADPRHVLRRNVEKAAALGYTYYVGPELEFFLFEDANGTVPLDNGGYFDLTPLDVASDFRRKAVFYLEKMGIPVEYSHHEVAPSQHEIDLRYSDAMGMADNVMTYRLVVKEAAHESDFYATFMPKPIGNQNGNGMHVHQSLFKGSNNAFFDASSPDNLSKTAKHYIAGCLKHAREMSLITNQWANSYKRLIPGFEAPVYVCWAQKNRSALIRVPMYREGHEKATRIELRFPDPSCNPYLAFAVMLAAGLEGIEKEYEIPEQATDNIYDMAHEERISRGIEELPSNLGEALEAFENSDLMRKALGAHVFEYICENKRKEWDEYRAQVHQYELDKYLPVL